MSQVRLVSAVIVLAFCGVIVTSCGGVGEDDPNIPLVTLIAPPTQFASGTCDETVTLEAWLQTVQFQIEAFDRLFNTANGKSQQAIREDLTELNRFRILVAETPAPDCAVALNGDILEAMGNALTAFQQYANGDRNDLDTVMAEAQSGFTAFQPEFDALVERMEAQFQQGS